MGSYIHENRAEISTHHYVRKTNTNRYWVDFSLGKIKCHCKIHYADISLSYDGENIKILINLEEFNFKRNIVTELSS